MTFADSYLVLIVGTNLEITTADATDQLAVLLNGLDGLKGDMIGMVVVIHTEPAAHDAFLGDLPIENDLNDVVKGKAGIFKVFRKCNGLFLGTGETIQYPAVFAIRFLQTSDHHRDRDIVRNQVSTIDIGLGLLAGSVPPPMCSRNMAPDSIWGILNFFCTMAP
jgi:hypothetical protein